MLLGWRADCDPSPDDAAPMRNGFGPLRPTLLNQKSPLLPWPFQTAVAYCSAGGSGNLPPNWLQPHVLLQVQCLWLGCYDASGAPGPNTFWTSRCLVDQWATQEAKFQDPRLFR